MKLGLLGHLRLEGRPVYRSNGFSQRSLEEDVSFPAIDLIDDSLTHQLVLADLRQDLGPYNPVKTTCNNDGDADDAVKVVRKALVDVLALLGRDEGGDDEVDVAEHEEDDDRETSANGRVPVPLLAVKVKVGQASGDENVDDSKGVCRSVSVNP